jgi:hypothetical protein
MILMLQYSSYLDFMIYRHEKQSQYQGDPADSW